MPSSHSLVEIKLNKQGHPNVHFYCPLCHHINWILKTAYKFCMMCAGMHVHIYNESIFIHLENDVESLSVNYTYQYGHSQSQFLYILTLA